MGPLVCRDKITGIVPVPIVWGPLIGESEFYLTGFLRDPNLILSFLVDNDF